MEDLDQLERMIEKLRSLGIKSYQWPSGARVEFRDDPPPMAAGKEDTSPEPNTMPTRSEIWTLSTTLSPPPVDPNASPLDKKGTP